MPVRLRDPGARARADRAAVRGDVVLRRRDLRARPLQLLVEFGRVALAQVGAGRQVLRRRVDAREQLADLADRLLRRPHGDGGVALGLGQLGPRLLDGRRGEAGELASLRRHARQVVEVGLRVLRGEPGEHVLGGVDPGRETLLLLRDLIEHLRGVAVEPAQLLERIGLRVERRVGALGELDELQRHRAILLGRLGEGVVELVLDLEGLLRGRLRVGERGAEVPDLVVAELRLGEAQLLLAGLQGVVQPDQELARPQLEGLDVGRRGIQDLLLRAPARTAPTISAVPMPATATPPMTSGTGEGACAADSPSA